MFLIVNVDEVLSNDDVVTRSVTFTWSDGKVTVFSVDVEPGETVRQAFKRVFDIELAVPTLH